MSDYKQNFCPSPWFHMRINNSGGYEYCRWAESPCTHNITDTTPTEYFQTHMSSVRQEFLDGKMPAGCHPCKSMEQQNKTSGRQKQLLKIGVRVDAFEKTLASSPWVPIFSIDANNQLPQDWQVDLGNYCNSACIFCSPESSSRLATEWKKIGFIKQLPQSNWTDTPELIEKFINTLKQTPHVRYIHFIGGETLITPSFELILKELIAARLNETATIGFTTNLSVWKDNIVELLEKFHNVNLGASIESFSIINDYVRYPVCLPTVFENLQRWVDTAKKNSWLVQLRTTPTCLTVDKLLPIYDYAWDHNIIVESCNFLYEPEAMKPSVLPMEHRNKIIQRMKNWIDQHNVSSETIVNIRNPNTIQAQLVQDLSSYVNYLENEPDESYRLHDLVAWLKRIEANRGNSILTYLPEYEELFKSAGY